MDFGARWAKWAEKFSGCKAMKVRHRNTIKWAIIQCLGNVLALSAGIAFGLWMLGYHIRHTPTAAELFGCEHTYINPQGEDTGECQ